MSKETYVGNKGINKISKLFSNLLKSKEDNMEEEMITKEEIDRMIVDPLEGWIYILSDKNNTITLEGYTGSASDIIINNKYQVGKKEYNTIIQSYHQNGKSFFNNPTNIVTVKFEDEVKMTECAALFYGCENLKSIDFGKIDTSSCYNMSWMFYGCNSLTNVDLSLFDTSTLTDMRYMFTDCVNLQLLDLRNFNTSKVKYVSSIFENCNKLNTILFGDNFKLSAATDIQDMFNGCASLTKIDLTVFNTIMVTNMTRMFKGCAELTKITFGPYFTTAGVKDMAFMFSGCAKLSSIDTTKIKTSQCTDMSRMFSGCESLSAIDVSGFDTSKVTRMTEMFYGCSELTSLDLRSFDTSKVTNMTRMFYDAINLTKILVTSNKWIVPKASSASDMFINCGCKSVTYA